MKALKYLNIFMLCALMVQFASCSKDGELIRPEGISGLASVNSTSPSYLSTEYASLAITSTQNRYEWGVTNGKIIAGQNLVNVFIKFNNTKGEGVITLKIYEGTSTKLISESTKTITLY